MSPYEALDLANQTQFDFEIVHERKVIMPNDDQDYTLEFCDCLTEAHAQPLFV